MTKVHKLAHARYNSGKKVRFRKERMEYRKSSPAWMALWQGVVPFLVWGAIGSIGTLLGLSAPTAFGATSPLVLAISVALGLSDFVSYRPIRN